MLLFSITILGEANIKPRLQLFIFIAKLELLKQ
jgi:hypothetical protein